MGLPVDENKVELLLELASETCERHRGVLVNIEAELSYWRDIFPAVEFGRMSLPFSHFVPTIKFGYDCYLLYPKYNLDDALPFFRQRYFTQVPLTQQVEWRWVDQILRHSWGRLKG